MRHVLAMLTRWIGVLNLFTALGAGVVGGVFFAFSSFVLPALARLAQPCGTSAMQSINVVVLNRSFLGVFLCTALGSSLLLVDAVARSGQPGAGYRLGGALLYLFGSLLVTMVCNVPLNEQLASVSPESLRAAQLWARFVKEWAFWNHVRTSASLAAALLLMLGLSGCSRYWECDPPAAATVEKIPHKLSETGLFTEPGELAAGVREFAPQFPLWSDGASKRRFIALPEGARIDGSDPDNWQFPVGTRLWKEFSVDGKRVETRFLQRTGPGAQDWSTVAYVWRADGLDAIATPSGKTDVLGTAHDVPAAGECWACHGGRKSFVLGFSVLQLSAPPAAGMLGLDELVATGRLSEAPSQPLVVPGGATAQHALGYLHANCGHCHNQDRPAAAASRCYDPENQLDFWLSSQHLGSVADTPAYRSGRGLGFEPGDAASSRMIELMSQRGFLRQMPPLGTERVDESGLAAVTRWIDALR